MRCWLGWQLAPTRVTPAPQALPSTALARAMRHGLPCRVGPRRFQLQRSRHDKLASWNPTAAARARDSQRHNGRQLESVSTCHSSHCMKARPPLAKREKTWENPRHREQNDPRRIHVSEAYAKSLRNGLLPSCQKHSKTDIYRKRIS